MDSVARNARRADSAANIQRKLHRPLNLMRIIRGLLIFIAIVTVVPPAWAQIGTLKGRVIGEDAKPLVGVIISIDRLGGITGHYEAKTDTTGSYTRDRLPAGRYKISVVRDGTIIRSIEDVRVHVGGTSHVDFDLSVELAH
jgi:hypothetical protein